MLNKTQDRNQKKPNNFWQKLICLALDSLLLFLIIVGPFVWIMRDGLGPGAFGSNGLESLHRFFMTFYFGPFFIIIFCLKLFIDRCRHCYKNKLFQEESLSLLMVKMFLAILIFIALGIIIIGEYQKILLNKSFLFEKQVILTTDKTEYQTDTEKIENVFMTLLVAQKSCDIELSNSIITKRSKEIMHSTCSNMAAEYKCYKDVTAYDYEIHIKNDKAILHFNSFSHKEGWPFFFAKENGEWKVDYHKMAFGISMGGSGCATGWGWRNEEIVEEVCSYFKEGECPEKQ